MTTIQVKGRLFKTNLNIDFHGLANLFVS